jgi:hypothetical protein
VQSVACNPIIDVCTTTRNPTNTPPPPELVVLGALKEMCEQVRRNNRSPEVAGAALAEEKRLLARISKLQTGAQSATAAEPA